MTLPPRRRDRSRAVVLGSVVAAVVAAVLMFAVVRFAADNPDKANLGSPVLRLGAGRLAAEIADGGPVLFQDPLDRHREVFVQHLGDDVDRGWSAIGAYGSTVSAECLLRWDGSGQRFVDPCTGAAFPPDGAGLTTYPATVSDGTVSVDLRRVNP
ncbi:MAG: hypothetical protein ACRD1K_10255 [Acidimicrobiales bacterium]